MGSKGIPWYALIGSLVWFSLSYAGHASHRSVFVFDSTIIRTSIKPCLDTGPKYMNPPIYECVHGMVINYFDEGLKVTHGTGEGGESGKETSSPMS